MPTLLVVDDEPAIQHAFRRAFGSGDYTLRSAGSAAEAVLSVQNSPPDVVILDVRLPDATGLETYHQIRTLDARIPVVLVTGHGTTDLAIEAMKEGAFDYLLKPLELGDLRELIGRAVRSSRRMRVPATLPEGEPAPAPGGDRLVGKCAAMQEVYKAIGRVARQDVTVLILGESGTGKELVARAIYQHSGRADKPFVAINCGAVPENLVESELFGHEKGAFTGADRKRIGRFEQANGGTVFLDEVAELPLLAQVKMLRLVQEQRFERVGGEETLATDVRLIAATNADLEAMADDGRFRKDLYFRLNVFTIRLPPLRNRGDDLPLLIDHYVRRYGAELGKPVQAVAPEALAALAAYPWPGNVRELQSVLKQALLRMRGTLLLAEDLPAAVTSPPPPAAARAGAFDWDAFVAERLAAGSTDLYAESVERMEREVLVRVLRHTAGNQLQAAKILGITRGSLRTKIRALGISINREVWSDDDPGDT
ncbi:MAG TPA: sigma-54 dependent transcriptional regulator [Gemmataceae bacterium]|nr:sigma-54 dependent transcriptional regulator [Gemmataceae bacterium]